MKYIKDITQEEMQWLIDNFADTPNAEITARLGISESSLHRLARAHGLRKSREYMRQTQANTAHAAQVLGRASGRFRRQSEQMKGKTPPWLEGTRIKKGECLFDTLTPERKAKARAKARESWRKTRDADRRRVLFGLPQLTRFKIGKQPNGKRQYRHNMRRKGYIELPGSKNVLYYPDEQMRRPRAEANAPKHGIKIMPMPTN